MLPLGGLPALHGALLEAAAAGADEVVVVIAPGKDDLRRWLADRSVLVAEQPDPIGTMDAVERGRARLSGGRVAVVYPDMLHLPDQRGLQQVARAAAAHDVDGTWYALVRRTPERAARMGRSARVETLPLGDGRHRVTAVHGTLAHEPGALHTVLLELRCPREEALLAARRADGDGALLPVLKQLAEEGLLFGLEPTGDVLDAGIPSGYTDASERFERGRARWRVDS
jgi:plasmid stabilization system protein ParE